MEEMAASLEKVSKRYRLGARSLRELIPNPFDWLPLRRRDGNGRRPKHIWALDDVSFSIRRGESLGIIGPNGAGKSTILKLLAGVTFPTKGEVQVSGRVCPLIEVGAGFHPDLTGRENIFLNGTILGLSRNEIQRKFDAIVEFSGLSEFIDTPVKRYSSGMYLRLGFAISTQVEPDLLLVDEVLA
ncbi:MAG: ATP-binding cassette domain-containing protein, partial [Armatimonadetes bacterium]|nr:ATP-binding cassette domain-containing protein [Armatimonadota bacterium]NIM24831.1 ATP-binding cassette domain-containing protein [Armatimonadota bacterium]NIM68721.1 ATP-binding cassette domain-containing protein [Armatimonadota bacterium]NIM76014.1 ATP-binding cassette domain-containing protein [Armatimonadota bacterium]NIN06918.1 ATP-binding cassette domain-containing protein [Armatimonadota bacterium]